MFNHYSSSSSPLSTSNKTFALNVSTEIRRAVRVRVHLLSVLLGDSRIGCEFKGNTQKRQKYLFFDIWRYDKNRVKFIKNQKIIMNRKISNRLKTKIDEVWNGEYVRK